MERTDTIIFLISEIMFEDSIVLDVLLHTGQAIITWQNNFKKLNHVVLGSLLRDSHIRPDLYFEDWLPNYLDTDFFRMFRITKATFFHLLRIVSKKDERTNNHQGGFMPISAEKSLLVTLWFLAKGETLRSIGDRFNLSDSTVLIITEYYIQLIADLSSTYIIWPKEEECKQIEEEFRAKRNFPGVIGAIDGCHICCKVPAKQHLSYTNRKQSHSIVLQGVCTSRCIFSNVFIGYPGSVHDSRVLQNSALFKNIEKYGANKYFYGKYQLLGDSAYSLRDWLIVRYIDYGHLSEAERNFNYIHSATRVIIENAFGRLKGRWRILQFVNVYSIQKVVLITTACCVLHNITYMTNDPWPETYEDDQEDNAIEENCHQPKNREYQKGVAKRNELKNQLWNLQQQSR